MIKRIRVTPPKKTLKKAGKVLSVSYIDRMTGCLKRELVPAEKWLKWLYNDPLGNLLLESVVKRKGLSKLYGRYMDSKRSSIKINSFVKIFDIDMNEYEKAVDEYSTFNEFFTRKLKPGARSVDKDIFSVTSPADGKVTAFDNIQINDRFLIKGYFFSISEFLNNDSLAKEYLNGTMMIVRLTPSDYHWFHFPVEGIPSESHRIKGKYYSVSPISIKNKTNTFGKNKREYSIIYTDHYDEVIMAEIGATFVGTLKQCYNPYYPYRKGDAKGYFKFGGSTVVILFRKDRVTIDDDILNNSRKSLETEVKMGERIGFKAL